MQRTCCCCCSVLALLFSMFCGIPSAKGQSLVSTKKVVNAALRKSTTSRAGNTVESRTDIQRIRASSATLSRLITFDIPLGVSDRHSLSVGTEFMRLTTFYTKFGDLEQEPEWKFKAVPLTLTYEYAFTRPDRRFVPVVGAGASFYVSKLSRIAGEVNGPVLVTEETNVHFQKEYGMGFGAQATLGVRTNINRHLYLTTQARYRYVNGLSIKGHHQYEGEFTVLDFAVGVGFKL